MENENDKSKDPPTPPPKQPQDPGVEIKQPSVSPSSVKVPGLGTGQLDNNNATEKKTSKSGALLQDLATPRVFQGPDVELARNMVKALEATIPKLDTDAADKWLKGMEEIRIWNDEFNKSPHTDE